MKVWKCKAMGKYKCILTTQNNNKNSICHLKIHEEIKYKTKITKR